MLKTLPKSKLRYNGTDLDDVCAAAWGHYRYWHEWQELAIEQRAYVIAAYRTERSMRIYQDHEAAKAVAKA